MNYIVTGPICSGKSAFLKIAKDFGFNILRSDEIVGILYDDKDIISKLKRVFNDFKFEVSVKDTVKNLFFESDFNRKEIENIFHPKVHDIVQNALQCNSNILVELPPLKNNIKFLKDNKSIYIDCDMEIRGSRYQDRNGEDNLNIFHKMNKYQTDCLLIKSYCDMIIKNDQSIDLLNDYFYKDIIKS